MKTYNTMYQGEIRALELLIRDNNDKPYNPTEVTARVVDIDGNNIIEESDTLLIDNLSVFLINKEVTDNIGNYEVIWKITKDINGISHVYYHKTNLNIEGL